MGGKECMTERPVILIFTTHPQSNSIFLQCLGRCVFVFCLDRYQVCILSRSQTLEAPPRGSGIRVARTTPNVCGTSICSGDRGEIVKLCGKHFRHTGGCTLPQTPTLLPRRSQTILIESGSECADWSECCYVCRGLSVVSLDSEVERI